ncbi:hypothetical protein [Paenisporosarcina sp.]|uniref:hypothetical protein n=1 Tax=Paenisporosarcina sp. TaxID=1932001 RepID=UPI003C772BA3
MEENDYENCNCQGQQVNNYDLNFNDRSYSRCCCFDYCCGCKHHRCRENLCDNDFQIRLAGLQGGLNYRLRQLLGCNCEIELDNGTKVIGKLAFVGSNFVEMLVEETLPASDETHEEVLELEIFTDQNHLGEEDDLEDIELEENDIREHEKGRTWIFSVEKIVNVVVDSSCHENKCSERTFF